MGTGPIKATGQIAVVAQKLESVWITVLRQPYANGTATQMPFSGLSPAPGYVVKRQELWSRFPTAGTLAPIMFYGKRSISS
jgi:hypothetical protein